MKNLKDRLEELEREHMANVSDPRLHLPSVTFYGQGSLGCGFTVVSIVPFAALAAYMFIDDPEAVKLIRLFLGAFTAFWVLTWVMNCAHVGKLRRQGKPGSAVVVDKFEYRDSDGDTQRAMVYETEHPQTGEPTQVIGQSQMPREYKMHIGTRIEFLRLPTIKILTRLSSRVWPEMWSRTPREKLANQVTGFAVGSGILLTLASLVGFWVRMTMLAFQLTWGDMFNAASDLRLIDMLTAPDLQFWLREAARRDWVLLLTAGAALVTVFGTGLFQMAGLFGEE